MRGHKVLALGLAAVVAFTFTACDDQPTEPEQQAQFKKDQNTGNGLPPGQHVTLHIHAADDALPRSTPDESKQNMWVKLEGKTKILLTEGDYYVVDANGLDGEAAFRLPAPDPPTTGLGDGTTTYTVYAIGRGPGSAVMTSCIIDDANQEVCSTGSTLTIDNKGKNWQNAVRELLYLWDITICVNYNTTTTTCDQYKTYNRLPLFGDNLEGFLWDYDNDGLRLATLRFYPCATTVGSEPTDPYNDDACFPQ